MRRYLPLFLISFFLLVVSLASTTFLAGHAGNRTTDMKSITIYTTLPIEQVSILAQDYEKLGIVRVNLIPLAEQDLLTRLRLEKDKPHADLILSDRSVLEQAAKDKLLANYASEQTDIIPDRYKDGDDMWIGLWFDPVVFVANQDFLKTMPHAPTKWSDLSKDSKVRLAMTDFLAAEASANLLFSLTSSQGEEATLTYFKKIHPQIIQYAKFLATPVRMAGLGEVDIAIAMQSESIRYANDGFPIKIIYPEDGTAYWLTGVGITANAPHSPDAKQFVEWLIQDTAQSVLQKNKFYFVPTNPELASYRDYSTKNLKLIDTTNTLSLEQKHKLLDRWVQTVRFSTK